MKHQTYQTHGTCSRYIDFDTDGKKVYNLKFTGGCMGNLLGISSLVDGLEIDEIIKRLDGIKCGFKQTSCPDQLAQALKEIKNK